MTRILTYPTDVKAQALALAIQGYTPYRIERTLGVDHKQVKRWIDACPEIPSEQRKQLIAGTVNNVLQADALTARILDYLADQPDKELVHHGFLLNAYSGTGKDKLVAFERVPQTAINIEQGIIIIQRGDAHALPPSDDAAADTIETHARLDVDIDAAVSADTPADTLAEFAAARAQPQNDGTSSLGDSSDDVRDDVGKPVQITGDEGHNQPVK